MRNTSTQEVEVELSGPPRPHTGDWRAAGSPPAGQPRSKDTTRDRTTQRPAKPLNGPLVIAIYSVVPADQGLGASRCEPVRLSVRLLALDFVLSTSRCTPVLWLSSDIRCSTHIVKADRAERDHAAHYPLLSRGSRLGTACHDDNTKTCKLREVVGTNSRYT